MSKTRKLRNKPIFRTPRGVSEAAPAGCLAPFIAAKQTPPQPEWAPSTFTTRSRTCLACRIFGEKMSNVMSK